MSNNEVLNAAISHYGDLQKTVAMEEMAELIKELSKDIRGTGDPMHIAEEIADTEIMLAQLKLIYGIHADVARYKNEKIERLAKRIADEEEIAK